MSLLNGRDNSICKTTPYSVNTICCFKKVISQTVVANPCKNTKHKCSIFHNVVQKTGRNTFKPIFSLRRWATRNKKNS